MNAIFFIKKKKPFGDLWFAPIYTSFFFFVQIFYLFLYMEMIVRRNFI